ncbi:hypothetical protein [Rhodopila sp.]|uniref:hypothetical protein n=1 Tax=Rhodopila sp. TaxID=2480087 RepID=UPI003D12B5B7
MTEADHAAVASIMRQADGLADQILAAEVPGIGVYRALYGLVNFAGGSGLFTATNRHQRALQRLPAETDMAAWAASEARLAAIRDVA